MQTSIKIEDFGQVIGGAKKDLYRQQIEIIKLITNSALITQPLSKVFPRPDFVKMYRVGQIDQEETIKLEHLYNSIPTKPRKNRWLNNWSIETMKIINLINQILNKETISADNNLRFFTSAEFRTFDLEMKTAEFPEKAYNPYPYKITQGWLGYEGKYIVGFKNRVQTKGTMAECVAWIREQKQNKKEKTDTKFNYSLYRWRSSGECFITPKGKSRIVLKKGFNSFDEARTYAENSNSELKDIYDRIRFVPDERRDWNRLRAGKNHRSGLDVSTDLFAQTFRFRGVEFGNWVNQVERAGNLNEAYDALLDMALVLELTPEDLTFNSTLALAFGARGSGKACAHYERLLDVINLTKKKGAGSLAHEWFHALDNFIASHYGHPLAYVSDGGLENINSDIQQNFTELMTKIKSTDFYTRSGKCDEHKGKPYWATPVELTARAFEKYIITKLAASGYENDYLANIKNMSEYGYDEKYPYPTDQEIQILSPLYDKLIQNVFTTILTNNLKQSA